MKISIIAAALCANGLMLAGCATEQKLANVVKPQMDTRLANLQKASAPVSRVDVVDSPYIGGTVSDYVPRKHGEVTVSFDGASLDAALSEVARAAKITPVFMSNVDVKRTVRISLVKADPIEALRDIAASAGYVAAVQEANGKVLIAERGTYTFKLNNAQLGQSIKMSTSAQVTPVNNSSAGSAGSTVGFTAESNAKDIEQSLVKLAGNGAEVVYSPASGLLNVSGTAQQLRRVRDYLEALDRDSGREVDIKATVVHVAATDTLGYGIDWSHLINTQFGGKAVDLSINYMTNQFQSVGKAFNGTMTGGNSKTTIEALKKFTQTNIMAQPRIIAQNNTPAIWTDTVSVPYLPSVQTTVSGTAGTSQTSANLQFANVGVTLTVKPVILDNSQVQISMLSQWSEKGDAETFDVQGTKLVGLTNPIRSSQMTFTVETGKTLIVSGMHGGRQTKQQAGAPGVDAIPGLGAILTGQQMDAQSGEVLLLINPEIKPAKKREILVSESV